MKTQLALALTTFLTGTASASSLNASTNNMLVFVETTAQTSPQYERYASSAWTAKAAATGVTSSVDWEIIRNCPIRDELTMLTSSDDRAIRIQTWSGSSWGSATSLTPDCGPTYDRVFDAEYEQTSGQLLTVYRKTNSDSLYYRTYTTASPAEQSYTPGLSAAPDWVQLAAKPGSDELTLIVACGANLYAAVWNGAAFGNFTTLSTTLNDTGRPYTCAYSAQTLKALVVWGNAATTTPKYTTWNGTAWAATASAPTVGAGFPTILRLASKPLNSSDEILLGVMDTTKHINVCNWTGSAWGTMTNIETSAAIAYENRFDLAYQPDGAKALVVWHTASQNAVRYRTWSSGAWSSTMIGPDMTTESQAIRLVPGVSGTDIMAAIQRKAIAGTLSDYLAYSQTGTVSVGTVEGLSGQQVSGISLPATPSYTAGATDKSYANNTTATLAPGVYRDLITGNSVTLNLSAGTYVFRRWTSTGNTDAFNCDTSAGDVNIVFTLGDVTPMNNNFAVNNNNGGGQVIIQLLTGNFDTSNNADVINASIIAYNGTINFGNNTTILGCLYAKGNITIGSGTIEAGPSPFPPIPSKFSVINWSAGSFSSATTVSITVPGYSQRSAFDISYPPLGSMALRVSRWREIGQDG